MADSDWQVRAQQRKRRINMVIGTLFCTGLVAGFLVGYFEDEQAGLIAANSIPPWLAITGAIAFLVTTIFGSWKLMKVSDELDRAINMQATVMAGNVLLIGYPTWFILWKGGLVPTPDALWLFVTGFITSTIVYGWKKFR